MKILHVQVGMTLAGNAAFRLHTAMLSQGIESKMLLLAQGIQRNNVFTIKRNCFSYIRSGINKCYVKVLKNFQNQGTYLFSPLPLVNLHLSQEILFYEADVIYLHWIAGTTFGIEDLEFLIKLNKPVIFFMHDMWTFTGGCHHSFDCTNYSKGCSDCKMFPKKFDLAYQQSKKKYRLFEKFDNIAFVSPSQWMADCAKSSFILKNKQVEVIPNLVDKNIFKPLDKEFVRSVLNLPLDKFIITFGCQAGTKNKFKGFDYLKDAINTLDIDNVLLVVYGSDFNQETVDSMKYPIKFLGPINDEYVLSLICNATDVFVSPSLAESYGLTFMENILCGTPVVGFNTTAIPEIVKTNITGYLSDLKRSDDLARGIMMLHQSRLVVEERNHYSPLQILKQHEQLINDILNRTRQV